MINDLLKKRFTTRFWDNSKEVPYELIQSVLQDVYDSPRKNGDSRIIVKVLTPSDAGEKMKDELLRLSWCRDGDKGAIDNEGPIRVQGQFTAPYVLLFGTKEEVPYDQHHVANATLQTTIATWKLAAKKTLARPVITSPPPKEEAAVAKVKVKKLQKRKGARVVTTKGKLRAAGMSAAQAKTIPEKASRGYMLYGTIVGRRQRLGLSLTCFQQLRRRSRVVMTALLLYQRAQRNLP